MNHDTDMKRLESELDEVRKRLMQLSAAFNDGAENFTFWLRAKRREAEIVNAIERLQEQNTRQ